MTKEVKILEPWQMQVLKEFLPELKPVLEETFQVVNPCKVCGKSDEKKPMCFRGEAWCSDLHRKEIEGDHTPQRRW